MVTGAAQGIGRAVARTLRDAGAQVLAADIDTTGLTTTRDELGVPVSTVDLGQRDAVHHLIADTCKQLGPVDIVVNCAGGVCGQIGQPIADVDEADWQAVFRANVDSAFWLAQAAAPGMAQRGWGRIITIASGAGLRPSLTGIQAYTAAKHALIGLTRQLSVEFAARGVTANAVAPGFVLSNPTTRRQWESYGSEGQARLVERIHSKRLGEPQDIANAVAFFASEAASWISGQVLSVDGGVS